MALLDQILMQQNGGGLFGNLFNQKYDYQNPQPGIPMDALAAQFGQHQMMNQMPRNAQFDNQPMLPPAAAPTTAQPQNILPPAQQPGIGDRISESLSNNPYLLMGLGSGIMQGGLGMGLQRGAQFGLADQQQAARQQQAALQRAQLESNYNMLIKHGYDEKTARMISLNPDIMKQIAPDLVPTSAAPPTITIDLPNGLKEVRQWDRQTKSYIPLNTNGPNPQTNAPGAPQAEITTPAPAPPPGVNVPEWNKKQADIISDNQKDARTKADGAMEFLQRSSALRQKLEGAPNDIFGFWGGSEMANKIRQAGSGLFPTDAKNAQAYDELTAAFGDLSSSLLKARFGSANLSDADRKAAEKLVGGLGVNDPKSAVQVLRNLEEQERAKLQDAVKRGLIPAEQAAPFLNPQQPQVQQQQPQIGPTYEQLIQEKQRRQQRKSNVPTYNGPTGPGMT